MTLDAGGTNFRFSAMRGGKNIVQTVAMAATPDNLKDCLLRLVEGFRRVKAICPEPPAAISFAFPGPANYPRGIIGDLGNLPCFRGGVPLGPILEDNFEIPTFMNNDGDLFAYGEAIGGLLPYVNGLLEKANNPRRYRNLLGVTIGTGFGGGIVRDGELFTGDNSMAGELWLMRNKLLPTMNVEESVSIRAVRHVYAELSGEPLINTPEPADIYRIAHGEWIGNKSAAMESFRRLGESAGDAIANALALVDGLVVIGGGLSGASSLFMPAVMAELNGQYVLPGGKTLSRLVSCAYNLDDEQSLNDFLKSNVRKIQIPDYINIAPYPSRLMEYDPHSRIGVGISRLGTSEAVSIGAYAFALRKLGAKTGD